MSVEFFDSSSNLISDNDIYKLFADCDITDIGQASVSAIDKFVNELTFDDNKHADINRIRADNEIRVPSAADKEIHVPVAADIGAILFSDVFVDSLSMSLDVYFGRYFCEPVKRDAIQNVKRGPGRPSNQPKVTMSPGPGIIQAPQSALNIMEFETTAIKEVKHALMIIKSFGCGEIKFEFTPHYVRLIAPVTQGKIVMFVHLSTDRAHSYFCGQSFYKYINIVDFKKLYMLADAKVDRIFYEQQRLITNIINYGTRNQNNVVIHQGEMKTLATPVTNFSRGEIDYTSYPIRFTIPATVLKTFLKAEDSKSQCYFTKRIEQAKIEMCVVKDKKPGPITNFIHDENAGIIIESFTSSEIITVKVPIAALSRAVNHIPVTKIILYMPPDDTYPFICVYKTECFSMQIYIDSDSI
jgi:hypothetical protein